MPTILIPNSLCASIHTDYQGDSSSKEVIDFIRLAAKKMIESAIRDELSPAHLPPTTESGLSQNISFPALESRVIRALAKQDGISEAHAAKRYLLSAIARGDALSQQQSIESFELAPFLVADKKKERHAQTVFFTCLNNALTAGKVGLIEAATGVGKTLAMIAAAATTLKRVKFGRVVIATPSIQVMRQFVIQHRKFADSMDIPSCRVILGRQEFISASVLRQVLNEGELKNIDPIPILEWLKTGCPAVGNGEDFGHRCLGVSLLSISPDFPVEVVRLASNTDANDPGAIVYREQFEREEDETSVVEIIYCTHAMVAVDIRFRLMRSQQHLEQDTSDIHTMVERRNASEDQKVRAKLGKEIQEQIRAGQDEVAQIARDMDIGHLPPWQFILIDEAHVFEQNLAASLTDYISVVSFLADMKKLSENGNLTAASVTRVTHALNALKDCAGPDVDEIDLSSNCDTSQQARAALLEIADAFKPKKNADANNPAFVRAQRISANLRRCLKDFPQNSNLKCLVKFSPVRQYPQIFFGQKSINRELYFLWATSTAAACVSATLYLRRMDVDSAAFYQRILSIPNERVREYPPIRPAWVVKPVTGLWVPEMVKTESGALWLSPPSRKDKLTAENHHQAESVWLNQVAEQVKSIHATATGGVLVLMTSYDSVKDMVARIGESIPLKVVASTGNPLFSQRSLFIKLSLEGHRPLWVTLGGAWTGLDVNGADPAINLPAEKDNLITDLVIPRIPFSLNRTMTHFSRMYAMSDIPWELLDTAMRFKQGLGRLVRREGLPNNRRIFVLDGRINDPQFGGYFSLLQRMMDIYPVKKLCFKTE